MRLLVTGGGTGGHTYPALAIARGVADAVEQVEILYVGTKYGMEADIVPRSGIEFASVSVEGFERRLSLSSLKAGAVLPKGMLDSFRVLKSFKPTVVVGTGGYVSGPVVLAAILKHIPTVIHEQNAFPGITNRMLSRFADRVCITFEESASHFRREKGIVVTGLPVRPGILSVGREQGLEFFGLDEKKKTLLVVGGSRGAQSINQAVIRVVEWITGSAASQMVFVTGRDSYQNVIADLARRGVDLSRTGNLVILPYLEEMEYGLAAADLVISRAGASFLAELTVRGIPAILVPYPHASNNHQEYNARALEKEGAALVVLDSELDGERLLNLVEGLLFSERLKTMQSRSLIMGKPYAVDAVVKQILEVGR